jgi:pimeloyl-ACP methyl ester carboxylesterase
MWILRIFRKVFLILLFASFFLLGIVLVGAVAEWRLQQQVEVRIPAPGKRVPVGSYRLHLHCVGRGKPTILLESGIGVQGSLVWADVQAELAKSSRVCIYDRAGHNWSDPSPLDRQGRNMVLELQRLLAQSGEVGPYLMVGHGIGATLVRLFYREQPTQVAGLVFLDSTHPQQEDYFGSEVSKEDSMRWLAQSWLLSKSGAERLYQWLFGPEVPDRFPLSALKATQALIPKSLLANTQEWLHVSETLKDEERLNDLTDVPVRVLVAGRYSMTPETEAIWLGLQQEIASAAGLPGYQIVKDSGHYMHLDRPDEVVRSILELIKNYRKKYN